MSRFPIDGIKGSKPQASPKQKAADTLPKEEAAKLNREYLVHRNETIRLKNLNAQMTLAQQRGQLVSRKLVEQQASWLLAALRQRVLNIPASWAQKLASVSADQARKILKELALSLLTEIRDLPNTASPNWLDELMEKEDAAGTGKRGK